ncbi:MAG: hypothetical protein EOO77_01640 [Oxalobacteraceae bacterium]|nr:MAG: hypothetical protein EOO77_01640 [Oxalobacteraceae bacterium]
MVRSLVTLKGGGSQAGSLSEGGNTPRAAAHNYLLAVAEQMNLSAEPHSSAISAVKLFDRRRRYLFSWIINAHHLLFYIRKPALKLMPSLSSGALERLRNVKINPAGEVTIRIETAADVKALTEWLFSPATWSDRVNSEQQRATDQTKPPAKITDQRC